MDFASYALARITPESYPTWSRSAKRMKAATGIARTDTITTVVGLTGSTFPLSGRSAAHARIPRSRSRAAIYRSSPQRSGLAAPCLSNAPLLRGP